ncbi:hypothetical protein MASR1M107_26470 [Ignavibacteriales bacterium]
MSKKFLIFFILAISTVSSIYCQPGKSYFPFISFFDHYVNAKMGVEPWGRRDEVDQPGINSGRYEMKWQGTNKYGEKVSSGVYKLEMCAKSLESSTEYRSSIKLLLTK